MGNSATSLLLPPYQEVRDLFRSQRSGRIARRSLHVKDFAALAELGYLRLGVPESAAGDWQSASETGPALAEIVRCLAMGDPSVALVAAMHPVVLAYWHNNTTSSQAKEVFATAVEGHWWGTMMSEPGSGGDVTKTKTTAAPADKGFLLSGEKHFASGSGLASYMVATAKHQDSVDLYFIDMQERSWDGTQGLALLREWDGHGMTGTQSHAFTLNNCPAQHATINQSLVETSRQNSAFSGVLFSAVIVGILDEAFEVSLEALRTKSNGMRALERVELVAAQNEHWQAVTLFESVRDAMGSPGGVTRARQAKYAIAGHAESALARLSKVVGGSSFGRTSPLGAPLGAWTQDVKALGFLRPPWALQSDQLFAALWDK